MESPDHEERSPELQRAIELAHAKLQAARAQAQAAPAEVAFSGTHEAAAVTSRFRLASLEQVASGREEIEDVVSQCIPIAGRAESGLWTLLPDVRATILPQLVRTKRLGEALRRSAAIAEEDDPLRAALTAFERDGPRALRTLPIAPLSAIAPFVDAIRQGRGDFPPRTEIDRRLELLRLLEPFARLVGSDFEGRVDELRDLRIYVDVLESQGLFESIARAISWTRKKPFLVFGVGGVGKSTLVAKFIQDHMKAAEWQPFPFAYLDFDRRAVLVDEPASILVEAVRQIGLQYEQAYESAEALRRSWRSLLSSASRRTKGGQRSDVRARESIRRDFVAFIQKLQLDESLPVLLVLDTFEEVQYRSRAFVETLRDFLGKLAEEIPKLRVVIVGRATVPEFAFENVIELAGLEEQPALAFLRKNGIADRELATAIFKQVGGNPLTLRLAAAVFRKEQETGAGDVVKLALVRRTNVQGQLFERILRHVHNPDVKKIAHPGLILRRVTPDIIREVLALPCGVDVTTPERAQALFDELQREIALVSPADEPGAVRHRPDVRKLMLNALRQEEPVKVEAIHHGAVAYYRRFEDAVSRAEEIYHLLSLGELEEVEKRFVPEVKASLWSAADEFSAPEKALLADLLGMEIPEDARASASQEIWERAAVRRIDEYLKSGVITAAVALLDERAERSAATLLRLREAAVQVGLGHLDRAAGMLAAAVRAYSLAGNAPAAFEALLAQAELARRQGIPATAEAALAEAKALACTDGDDVWLLRVLLAREQPAIDEIRRIAARIDDERWLREPALLRKTAAAVGGADVELVRKAVQIAGGYGLRPEDERRLEEALAGWGTNQDLHTSIWQRTLYALGDSPSRVQVADAVAHVFAEEARGEPQPAASTARGPKLKIGTGEIQNLVKLLVEAGLGEAALGDVLVRRFDRNLAALSFSRELHTTFVEVLHRAESEGWLAALLDALRQSGTPSAKLLNALDALGIGVRAMYAGGPTLKEKTVAERVQAHRTAVLLIEQRICRIEVGGAFRGTGFLIGPSTVLTSSLVLDPNDLRAIVVRFDYGAIGGTPYNEGVSCGARMLGLHDEHLRVLELARPVGDEPVGGSRASRNSPVRRSLDLHSGARAYGRTPLSWFWHSEKDGLQAAGSDTLTVTDGGIAFPVNDRDRFAGAPCFDEDFRLVGVQCGPHPARRREALVLPVQKVFERIESRLGYAALGPKGIRLTGPELAELADAVLNAFDRATFEMVLQQIGLDRKMLDAAAPLRAFISEVLQHAQLANRLGALLDALANERPQNTQLDHLRRRYLGR